MELHNHIEDIVENALDELLKTRPNVCKCDRCILDMKAYALNRIPPKYIVSERGLLHSEINGQKDIQFQADVINTANDAIHVISSQLRPGYFHYEIGEEISLESLEKETEDYYFNFFHIIGSVFSGDNMDAEEGIKITFMDRSGQKTEMAEQSWQNPCITNKITNGFFSFWPAPQPSGKKRKEARLFRYRLLFEKEGFKSVEVPFQFRLFSENSIRHYIRKNHIKKLKPVILQKY